MIWTQERSELCAKFWKEGFSASQVAARLGGITRNSVISKVHRMDLPRRATLTRSYKAKKSKAVPERKPKYFHPKNEADEHLRREPLPPEPPRPAKLFKLANMEDDQCRFFYGDPRAADSGYCGCKKMPGSSFCPGHHAKVWQGVPVRTKSADIPEWRGKHRLDKHGSKYAGKAVAV